MLFRSRSSGEDEVVLIGMDNGESISVDEMVSEMVSDDDEVVSDDEEVVSDDDEVVSAAEDEPISMCEGGAAAMDGDEPRRRWSSWPSTNSGTTRNPLKIKKFITQKSSHLVNIHTPGLWCLWSPLYT